MILTRATLDSLQVSHKCWSRAQYNLLEVPFPPAKGWLKRIEGKFISDTTHQQLKAISQQNNPVPSKSQVLPETEKPL